jgi:hypothetical protein
MTILENVSEEFLEWLNNCPVQWFLDRQDKDTITYTFEKDLEED